MKIDATTKQKDPKWLDQYKASLGIRGKKEVAVGFPRGEQGLAGPHYPVTQSAVVRHENKKPKKERKEISLGAGPSIIEVAIWNNFGTANIPRRPFMDNARPKLQEMYKKRMAEAAPDLNAGKINEEAVLQAISIDAKTVIQTEIDLTNSPGNSEEWAEFKQSEKPLIDSQDMRHYVTGVVRAKTT